MRCTIKIMGWSSSPVVYDILATGSMWAKVLCVPVLGSRASSYVMLLLWLPGLSWICWLLGAKMVAYTCSKILNI